MPKFRKRPIVVTAEVITGYTIIHTLEGDMAGHPGDWLVTGVNGEQYPVKPDIFGKTYEPAEVQPAANLNVYICPRSLEIGGAGALIIAAHDPDEAERLYVAYEDGFYPYGEPGKITAMTGVYATGEPRILYNDDAR